MSLTLAPATEARLRAFAAQRGQDPEDALTALLDEALAAAADFDQAVAGIRTGMEDFAVGRWVSLEDYEAQVRKEKQARQVQEVQPSGGQQW